MGVLNVDAGAPHPAAAALAAAAAACAAGGGAAAAAAADGGARRARVGLVVDDALWVPDAWPRGAAPVVARVVSRGALGAAASDFGGLEVFGGASIGHTDPWAVVAALDEQLALL